MGSIRGTGPILHEGLKITAKLNHSSVGTAFVLQTAKPRRGSGDHVKRRSYLQ